MSRELPAMELPIVGRLRLGGPKQKNRPGEPLDFFRATAAIREDLEELAQKYGDPKTIEPWESPNGHEWQTVLTEAILQIALPPYADTLTGPQYELFNAGHYLVRSCDGRVCWTPDKAQQRWADGPCLCDPEEPECTLVVRLKVVVLGVPAHGVWLLEAHGAHAARHWPAQVHMAQQMAQQGRAVLATIRIESRTGRSALHGLAKYKTATLRLEEPFTLPALGAPPPPAEAPALPPPPDALPDGAEFEADDSLAVTAVCSTSEELAAEEPSWLDMSHTEALSTGIYPEFAQRLRALGATIGQYQKACGGGSVGNHSLRRILSWAAEQAGQAR